MLLAMDVVAGLVLHLGQVALLARGDHPVGLGMGLGMADGPLLLMQAVALVRGQCARRGTVGNAGLLAGLARITLGVAATPAGAAAGWACTANTAADRAAAAKRVFRTGRMVDLSKGVQGLV